MAFALISLPSTQSLAANDNRIYNIRLGILGTDAGGNYFLAQETTVIPLKYKDSGFRYGLIITSSDGGPFEYQCVFHFSGAPKVITGAAFDSDQASATMRTPKVQAQGSALEYYWFDPGDPSGNESVDILINDKLVKTINYTVVPEK
jgi:hypothetical protein